MLSITRWMTGRSARPALPPRLLGALALLATLFVVAACGDSDSSDSTTSSDGGSSSQLDGTPVKVAALVDDTGPNNGGQGESIPVLEAWVKQANENGGVAGHPVELKVFDTQGNPSKTAGFAQEVIADRSFVAVVSVQAATETNALRTFSRAGVPVIGGTTADPGVWGTTAGNRFFPAPPLPGVFAPVTAFPATIEAFVAAGQQHDLRSMISVNFSQVPASRNGTDLVNAIASRVGMQASSVTVDASAPNFSAECLRIVQRRADYVTFFTPPDLAARVIRDCNTQGFEGSYGGTGGNVTAAVYDNVGDNRLVGAWFAFPSYAETPWGEAYREAMESGGVEEAAWQGAYGPSAWVTMEMFRSALDAQRARLPDTVARADVMTAYESVRDETLDGMLPGPVTFARGSVALTPCYWLFTYEGGEFTGGSESVCPDRSLGVG